MDLGGVCMGVLEGTGERVRDGKRSVPRVGNVEGSTVGFSVAVQAAVHNRQPTRMTIQCFLSNKNLFNNSQYTRQDN